MRLHITLDDGLVSELDRIVGTRQRSSFIATAPRRAIDEHTRFQELESALGSLADSEHDWDVDPGAWVRAQRTNREQRAS